MVSAVPKHSLAFRARRLANWLPMGLAYAFLQMGRYNLTVAKNALNDLLPKDDFGWIFGVGSVVYGVSFLLNGPLIDKYGGRWGFLVGLIGALIANVAMGLVLFGATNWGWALPLTPTFMVLYGVNMYFQSFGAVSIVTVKAPWFHVRERGTFSTIFGLLIAFGMYFAFDWGEAVVDASRAAATEHMGLWAQAFRFLFGLGGSGVDQNWMIFFVPAIFMGLCGIALFIWLRNSPAEAGYQNFDTGEETLSHDGERLPVFTAVRKILTHPVLIVVVAIEFCSGVLRHGIVNWYPVFAKEVGFAKSFFMTNNWGLMLLIAGVLGAQLSGLLSDKLFQSRRGPMAGILYGVTLVAGTLVLLTLGADPWFVGIGVVALQMAVIGVHGILSGTATVDFGGAKNTGIVVGVVDGFVYLGTGLQSVVIGLLAPTGADAKDPEQWIAWPAFLLPFALAGLLLSLRIWKALPRAGKGGAH